MGSVYPIPVLHAPYRTCKTERSSPMNLLGEVYDKDSWNFLNGSENHFTRLSQKFWEKISVDSVNRGVLLILFLLIWQNKKLLYAATFAFVFY